MGIWKKKQEIDFSPCDCFPWGPGIMVFELINDDLHDNLIF